MKGALVLWIGFALIAADLLVTKQGQNLWNLFTQPTVPKDTTANANTSLITDPGAVLHNLLNPNMGATLAQRAAANAPGRQTFK